MSEREIAPPYPEPEPDVPMHMEAPPYPEPEPTVPGEPEPISSGGEDEGQ